MADKLLVLYPFPPDVTETSCGSCAFRSLVECQLFGDYGDPDMMMTRNDACREAAAKLTHGRIDLTVVDHVGRLERALAEATARAEKAERERDEARAERDARPEITAEDAARVASWMDAAIFDGIDDAIDPPTWAYTTRDALRAHARKAVKP